jgi:hypothetical protein
LCFLLRIAAGVCERVAGSRGASRPRSGAVGALDAAIRERIILRSGAGSREGRIWVLGVCLLSVSEEDPTVRSMRWRQGQPGLPRSSGLWPGDMMIDWVSLPPGGGMRPLILFRPSDVCAVSQVADSMLLEPAVGCFPIS